jgi:predicted RNase H-like HicB family nuclease
VKYLMPLRETIKALIRPGEESGFVAECLDIPVMTPGESLRSVTQNLQEALAQHLQGKDLEKLGFTDHPTLLITLEIEPTRV